MIRFDCPGCGKAFRVDPSKAGKTARCQTCGHQFVVPAAEEPTTPAEVEVDPCPRCETEMSVAATDIGKEVACPYCRNVFVATARGVPLKMAPAERTRDDREEEARHSLRTRFEDDDENEDDEDDDDRPRRRRKKRRYYDDGVECKKVTAGILALFFGWAGVHKFYLGYTGAGLIQLGLWALTCGAATFIGIAEGIVYLAKTDAEFIEVYQDGQREWF